ncbi:hypothetical protein, partial [Vibrio navarrensis]|uniref:hypothetical protein n=1 Tax=Vibrio navarrensis TaxID=29495 RepID=UPI00057C36A3
TLDLPKLRLTLFGFLTNHLSFKTRIDSNFVAFHAIWKPENFNKSLSENSKLPKRLCTKLANLAQSENSIEATAQNSRYQTILICRKT